MVAMLALLDPLDGLMKLIVGLLGHLVDHARSDIADVLNRYLFTTVDTTRPGGAPLTQNPALGRLNLGVVLIVDALCGGVVLFTSIRTMFEKSIFTRYALKETLPRLLAAIALAHCSMFFIQMAIDLNNALSRAALALGGQVSVDNMPWSGTISAPAVNRMKVTQDIFHAIFAIGVVIGITCLALSYVVRTALLNILIVMAPLAALLGVLPDTRAHSHTWLSLFLATVFMQSVQMIILRVALSTGFDTSGGIAESLYAMATLYLMLKVPGSLNIASHFETKAHTLGHHAFKATKKAVTHHPASHKAAG